MLLLFKPWEYIKPKIWFNKTPLQIFKNIILSLMVFYFIVLYRSIRCHFLNTLVDMGMNKILINSLGIQDSGGVVVFSHLLDEIKNTSYKFLIVCNGSRLVSILVEQYKEYRNLKFIVLKHKSLVYRLYYENIHFKSLIKSNNIQLIYNFSGSAQLNFLMNTLQLIKVHNLLFYSRNLDAVYHSKTAYFEWLKQVFLKRLYFKFMLNQSKYIEVQSNHVQDCLSNFIDTKNKNFYEKRDIDVCNDAFGLPRKYDFSKKIKFLYVVGPHFESVHKNFITFVNALSAFDRLNIDYEINITLSKDQLHNSEIWNSNLDSKTNFLGYIDNQNEMNKLFCNNAILISTSIIETLGLHVIEGIKNGIITIAPNENYARTVYGDNMNLYDTLNSDSLLNAIQVVLNSDSPQSELILSLQDRLKKSEMAKHSNILDIFKGVLNV